MEPGAAARALAWITRRLEALEIPYQIAGGLAAIAHGSGRPLNDIDIYVPEGTLDALAVEVADHRSHGPHRYRGPQWDCYFMELHYAGQEIELAEAGRTRYRMDEGHPWHEANVDFENPDRCTVFGVEVAVMPVEKLVEYKRRLDREVDRQDLAALDVQAPTHSSQEGSP